MTQTITPEMIRVLAATAGIDIPEEDETALATGLSEHLVALDELTRRLDLANVDPAVAYDARWQ